LGEAYPIQNQLHHKDLNNALPRQDLGVSLPFRVDAADFVSLITDGRKKRSFCDCDVPEKIEGQFVSQKKGMKES
jgi:hypothetical protein